MEKIVYRDYEEVPVIVRKYIEEVADVYNYAEIPLEDINGLMEAAEEYYDKYANAEIVAKPTAEQMVEWEDGWVL